jgi:hypothetical protein
MTGSFVQASSKSNNQPESPASCESSDDDDGISSSFMSDKQPHSSYGGVDSSSQEKSLASFDKISLYNKQESNMLIQDNGSSGGTEDVSPFQVKKIKKCKNKRPSIIKNEKENNIQTRLSAPLYTDNRSTYYQSTLECGSTN